MSQDPQNTELSSSAQQPTAPPKTPHPTKPDRARKRVWRFAILGVLAVAAAGLIGYSFAHRNSASKTSGANGQSSQGKSQDMAGMPGMKMDAKPQSKGKAQDMAGMPGMKSGGAAQSGSETDNMVFVPPEKQQLIGMRSVAAVSKPLIKEIRMVGKVTYDETKITRIHTKFSGYIDQVFADSVGKPVRAGDPLFTIYSPDLVATQQEYLLALKSRKVLQDSSFPWISDGSDNLIDAARSRLRLWDVPGPEIKQLEKEGTVKRAIEIYSPVNGIITERKAYQHGTFVNPEMELYTIVDLSRVWVIGEIYEYELPYVKAGQEAKVDFPYDSTAKGPRGRVNYVYPYLDPKTRTAQVRLEFANPALALKPDMFTNVKLRINLGTQLVVPLDAVLTTGTEQYVFIDKGHGYVEPRLVQIGAAAGDNYGIEKGLKSGEKVVTAANFLVDAESRLKGAFANMGKPSSPAAGAGQSATAENLKIEILEPTQAKVGGNPVRAAVHDASGQPVEGAQVEIRLSMPQMGNMPPMSSKAVLQSSGGGQYTGTVDVPMAWTWQTTITVKRGDQVIGTKQLNLTAR